MPTSCKIDRIYNQESALDQTPVQQQPFQKYIVESSIPTTSLVVAVGATGADSKTMLLREDHEIRAPNPSIFSKDAGRQA